MTAAPPTRPLPRPRVSVAILAGGRGRRLQEATPKAQLIVGGRTLLDRAVACALAASDDVLVVAPPSLGSSPAGTRAVDDAIADAGPLSALVAGLEAARGDVVVALGVDLPRATPELLRELASAIEHEPADVDAVVPILDGRAQPMASAYRRHASVPLRSALEAGARALVPAIESLNVSWREAASLPGGADALLDVDTPLDRERAERALAAPERKDA